MSKATRVRPGMIIRHEGDLYAVYSVDHRTPGNKRGAMQTKMRNLRSGSMMDYRFRAKNFDVTCQWWTKSSTNFSTATAKAIIHEQRNLRTIDAEQRIVGDTKDYLIPKCPSKSNTTTASRSGICCRIRWI